jgi:hypothetical protein
VARSLTSSTSRLRVLIPARPGRFFALKPPLDSPSHHPAPTQVLHKGDDPFRSCPGCRHHPAARPHASCSLRLLHICMVMGQSGPTPCRARRTRHKDRNCDVGMGAQTRCLSATCAMALLRLPPRVWMPGVLIWDLGVYPGIAAAGGFFRIRIPRFGLTYMHPKKQGLSISCRTVA